MADNYIITIQRQFGSLGRPIAQKLAKLLNVEYYDRDIVELTSKELNLPKSDIADIEEKSYGRMRYPLGLGHNHRKQDYLFSIQQCVIMELATHDKSCIIVGRCSDYVLRHYKNTINIFIYAPYEARFYNCIHSLGMEEQEAKDMIREVDKARNNYHKYYTGEPAATVEGRQFLIDSSMLGVDGTAELIADIVRRAKEHGYGQEETESSSDIGSADDSE
ncbi:MAG: cytidylate kinase-like family protein [Lachnospiraceae bacterium]|nr:cytidylate kinase-like family protein [Lachnospiraceae bacterium]